MNAIMSYNFLSQRYERDNVKLIKVEADMIHASILAKHTTHFSLELDNHLEVRCSTPHITAVIIALHLFYKLEWVATNFTLKHITAMLNVII